MAVREQAVVAHHLDRPVERHRVHVRAQEHGGRALRSRHAREQVARVGPGLRARCRPPRPRCPSPRQLLGQRLRDRALAARRALDLAEADELGEEPLALLARYGVDHAANATARSGQPSRSQRGTPAVHHVDHVARAEPLQQARGDRGALPRRADHRHRPLGVELVRQLVDVVVGGVDRAGDVAARPTPTARGRRAAAARSSRRSSARAAPPRSAARTRSTGRFSSRHEVMPPAR